MTNTSALASQLAAIISDYRAGEITPIDGPHVEKWINQFPDHARDRMLTELLHVFGNTYITKGKAKEFLSNLTKAANFVGNDPAAFWKGVKFLDIQKAGNSQKDFLALFDTALQETCGLAVAQCGANPHTYVYLDDALFSGGRIKSDIIEWIESHAPTNAKLAIVTIGIHALGKYFAAKDIAAAAAASNKTIETSWWCAVTLEDRKAYMTNSDVLRPTTTPAVVQAYVDTLGAPVVLRIPGGTSPLGIFTSDASRIFLEEELLKTGVTVREKCPHLNIYMRPLGCSLMRTTGFGSMLVTYRNCANNTPLALWAGDPWHPLFPRKTN